MHIFFEWLARHALFLHIENLNVFIEGRRGAADRTILGLPRDGGQQQRLLPEPAPPPATTRRPMLQVRLTDGPPREKPSDALYRQAPADWGRYRRY